MPKSSQKRCRAVLVGRPSHAEHMLRPARKPDWRFREPGWKPAGSLLSHISRPAKDPSNRHRPPESNFHEASRTTRRKSPQTAKSLHNLCSFHILIPGIPIPPSMESRFPYPESARPMVRKTTCGLLHHSCGSDARAKVQAEDFPQYSC